MTDLEPGWTELRFYVGDQELVHEGQERALDVRSDETLTIRAVTADSDQLLDVKFEPLRPAELGAGPAHVRIRPDGLAETCTRSDPSSHASTKTASDEGEIVGADQLARMLEKLTSPALAFEHRSSAQKEARELVSRYREQAAAHTQAEGQTLSREEYPELYGAIEERAMLLEAIGDLLESEGRSREGAKNAIEDYRRRVERAQ